MNDTTYWENCVMLLSRNEATFRYETIFIMSIKTKEGDIELDKAKPMITVEIIEYVENAIVIKTILKKSSGNISVMSVDTGEGLTERTSPFDTFAQVIDGKVELVISGILHLLHTGGSIIIPAHAANHVKPDGRFKMVLTVLKSGYE
jgi:quercetin dioxygenase-like cupin family protein